MAQLIKVRNFVRKILIEHIVCPVRDLGGSGKVERMTRTNNERLRTNKEIFISKEKKGLSKILIAMRAEKGSDGKSAFENYTQREPNTSKSRLIE